MKSSATRIVRPAAGQAIAETGGGGVAKVLGLYREKYFDLNVRHFHEKLQEEHQVAISYSWAKGILQGAGMMATCKPNSPGCVANR